MTLVHINISDKTLEMIDKIVEGKSLTDKVRNYLESTPVSRDYLLLEYEKCKMTMKLIEKNLKLNPFYDKNLMPEKEKKFLIDAIKIVQENPDILYGKKEFYNREFNKKITLNEFKLLLFELKEELDKNKVVD